ncbi:MAG: peptide-methionine (R)-S-oxide reductase MsrB [Geminicoccaceae bacterium]
MLSRRKFGLLLTTAIIMTGASRLTLFDRQAQAADEKHFEITRSDEEWRRLLTPDQYEILRGHGTERAGSSPLDDEKRAGTFACAGCDLPLFSSKTKYDSRTGWPSFWAPLDDAIGTSVDNSFFMTRIEVHCRRCGGHLGHVFEDGPPPTGLRYCMNGIAMTFVPDEAQTSGNT